MKLTSPQHLLKPEIRDRILDFDAQARYVNVPWLKFDLPIPVEAARDMEHIDMPIGASLQNMATIPYPPEEPVHAPSATRFRGGRGLKEEELHRFLSASYLARHTATDRPHRPYASAGALYPVEIIVQVAPGGVQEMDPGIYQVLALSRKLHQLQTHCAENQQLFTEPEWGPHLFSVVYIIRLSRACAKYRFRGYRHALIEAGLLAATAGFGCRSLGFHSRCWSGFCDDTLIQHLGLEPTEFIPAIAQVFGWEAQPQIS